MIVDTEQGCYQIKSKKQSRIIQNTYTNHLNQIEFKKSTQIYDEIKNKLHIHEQ